MAKLNLTATQLEYLLRLVTTDIEYLHAQQKDPDISAKSFDILVKSLGIDSLKSLEDLEQKISNNLNKNAACEEDENNEEL